MFFHLQYIHLFRPFLKYTPAASPLPTHVSPRRICTANAGAISKLMRLYKKLYGLRQICNIAVYMVHSACTIHLLNVPEKSARRDIIHGVKHLEEIADDWLCARRTLSILSVLARNWGCDIPEDAASVLGRADEKYGYYSASDVPSLVSSHASSGVVSDGSSLSPGDHSSPTGLLLSQVKLNEDVGPGPLDDRMTLLVQSSQMVEEVSHRLSLHREQSMRLHMPIDFDANFMEEVWTNNPVSAAASRYDSPFFPLDQRFSIPQLVRQIVPRRMPVKDAGDGTPNGQDWMLDDRASWQQNFEGWGLGDSVNSGPPPGVFLFSQNRSNSFFPRSSGANREDQRLLEFEGLDTASLSGGGWLPGLD